MLAPLLGNGPSGTSWSSSVQGGAKVGTVLNGRQLDKSKAPVTCHS